MGFNIGDVWGGVVKIADAVGTVFGDRGGTPGAARAPSLIGQKPNLNFARISAGEGAGLMAGTGRIQGAIPYATRQEAGWITLQKRYLAYLNMAEAFEEPGKVRRAIKLKV
jgi:hypothetical protein